MIADHLLRDLLVIERRLAEKLREEGKPTVRGYCKGGGDDDYGVWISPHGVIIEVDNCGHYAASDAIFRDAGLPPSKTHLPERLMSSMGFIRIVYSAATENTEFVISISRAPTGAQFDALAKIVRRSHRLAKDRRYVTLEVPCGNARWIKSDMGTIRAAIEEGCR